MKGDNHSGWARIVAGLFGLGLAWMTGSAAMAAVYLETNRSCTGALLDRPQRLEIVGWDGDSRQALGQRVYDFKVRCGDSERDLIDLFLTAERSDRYRREDNVLQRLKGTQRRSVQVRDAGCKQVPKRVRTTPSDQEVRETCRNQRMPMACQIEMLSQERWVTKMVEECWRAQFETREVPIWEAFPDGHAPLPGGSRIIQVSTRPTGQRSGPSTGPPVSGSPSGGGSQLGLLLVLALLAGGAFYYYKRKNLEALREQVASARRQMGGENRADYGAGFGTEGFQTSSGFARERSHDRDRQANEEQQFHDEARPEQPKRSPDDLPQTLEEACALFNVTKDTPPVEVNRIYKGMAMVWHVDKSTNEADRQRREAKMKQLNAAKEFLLGKR